MKKKTYDEEELNNIEVPEGDSYWEDDLSKDGEAVAVEEVDVYVEPEPETVILDKPLPSGDQVSIVLVNTDEFNGRYLIMRQDTREFLLISKDSLPRYTVKPQSIDKRYLDGAEKPYNWETEIESLAISREEIREALWREGLISPESVAEGGVRSLVVKLIGRGKLPVIKERN